LHVVLYRKRAGPAIARPIAFSPARLRYSTNVSYRQEIGGGHGKIFSSRQEIPQEFS
jgi:hypothetical protein